jgi:hypothetical protein
MAPVRTTRAASRPPTTRSYSFSQPFGRPGGGVAGVGCGEGVGELDALTCGEGDSLVDAADTGDSLATAVSVGTSLGDGDIAGVSLAEATADGTTATPVVDAGPLMKKRATTIAIARSAMTITATSKRVRIRTSYYAADVIGGSPPV